MPITRFLITGKLFNLSVPPFDSCVKLRIITGVPTGIKGLIGVKHLKQCRTASHVSDLFLHWTAIQNLYGGRVFFYK